MEIQVCKEIAGRYAPLTYYEDVLEASRNMFMARNAREIIS